MHNSYKIFLFVTLSAVLLFNLCLARPADDAAELSNDADPAASTNDVVVPDTSLAESSKTPVHAEKADLPEDFNIHSQAEDQNSGGKSGFRISLLQPPIKARESVNLESEAIPSKILSIYDKGQQKLLENSDPVPIVDTISEHEKYGNYGDMFSGISRSIVNGYEAFSNILNAIIRKPQEIVRSLNKSVNAQLDLIGGKLVGL